MNGMWCYATINPIIEYVIRNLIKEKRKIEEKIIINTIIV